MGHDEEEPKLFTLTEAERTRRELEPVLIEAVETRRKLLPLDEELGALSARIQTMGGIVVPYEKTARLRFDRDRLAESLSASVREDSGHRMRAEGSRYRVARFSRHRE